MTTNSTDSPADDATGAPDDGVRRAAAAARQRGEVDGGWAPDPVNAPMVRHWVGAMGDANPVYLDEAAARAAGHDGIVAPPAMLQVWTMRGPEPSGPGGATATDAPESAVDGLLTALDAAGYRGVVATNCEQTFDRYLRPGEHLRSTTRLGDLAGPKRTGMGTGYFLTWHTTWYSGAERVGEMLFRVLKFAPPEPGQGREPQAEPAGGDAERAEPYPLRPARTADTDFFWEGAAAGELRVQRCADCKELRHPPGPMCPRCHSTNRDHVVAAGEGTVHSYVVHHHPPVPGRTPPYVVAVVQLPEGVRVVGNVLGVRPDQVTTGMPVRLDVEWVDADLALPQWRPLQLPPDGDSGAERLPGLELPLSRTSIVSQALATRDFQPMHHDPDAARAQGAPDVFLNILTTQGLVQRYVTDWAGPAARVRAIAIRLGVPSYAGDRLTFTGTVTERHADRATVSVRGTNRIGTHVTGTVTVEGAPAPAPADGKGDR